MITCISPGTQPCIPIRCCPSCCYCSRSPRRCCARHLLNRVVIGGLGPPISVARVPAWWLLSGGSPCDDGYCCHARTPPSCTLTAGVAPGLVCPGIRCDTLHRCSLRHPPVRCFSHPSCCCMCVCGLGCMHCLCLLLRGAAVAIHSRSHTCVLPVWARIRCGDYVKRDRRRRCRHRCRVGRYVLPS